MCVGCVGGVCWCVAEAECVLGMLGVCVGVLLRLSVCGCVAECWVCWVCVSC